MIFKRKVKLSEEKKLTNEMTKLESKRLLIKERPVMKGDGAKLQGARLTPQNLSESSNHKFAWLKSYQQ